MEIKDKDIIEQVKKSVLSLFTDGNTVVEQRVDNGSGWYIKYEKVNYKKELIDSIAASIVADVQDEIKAKVLNDSDTHESIRDSVKKQVYANIEKTVTYAVEDRIKEQLENGVYDEYSLESIVVSEVEEMIEDINIRKSIRKALEPRIKALADQGVVADVDIKVSAKIEIVPDEE